jgi:hypothetical protein
MNKFLSSAVIMAATVIAVSIAAPAAKATTITTTWTGLLRIAEGDTIPDNANAFDSTPLAKGDTFTLVSTFHTNAGSNATGTTGGGTAVLTIHGVGYTFNESPSFYDITSDHIVLGLGTAGPNSNSLSLAFDPLGGLPSSILTAFDGSCVDFDGGYCSGSFGIYDFRGQSTGATIDATHIHVDISAAPIPATLPLFASALLGLGVVARRKKAGAAV